MSLCTLLHTCSCTLVWPLLCYNINIWTNVDSIPFRCIQGLPVFSRQMVMQTPVNWNQNCFHPNPPSPPPFPFPIHARGLFFCCPIIALLLSCRLWTFSRICNGQVLKWSMWNGLQSGALLFCRYDCRKVSEPFYSVVNCLTFKNRASYI
jgi:hypothetical protein